MVKINDSQAEKLGPLDRLYVYESALITVKKKWPLALDVSIYSYGGADGSSKTTITATMSIKWPPFAP